MFAAHPSAPPVLLAALAAHAQAPDGSALACALLTNVCLPEGAVAGLLAAHRGTGPLQALLSRPGQSPATLRRRLDQIPTQHWQEPYSFVPALAAPGVHQVLIGALARCVRSRTDAWAGSWCQALLADGDLSPADNLAVLEHLTRTPSVPGWSWLLEPTVICAGLRHPDQLDALIAGATNVQVAGHLSAARTFALSHRRPRDVVRAWIDTQTVQLGAKQAGRAGTCAVSSPLTLAQSMSSPYLAQKLITYPGVNPDVFGLILNDPALPQSVREQATTAWQACSPVPVAEVNGRRGGTDVVLGHVTSVLTHAQPAYRDAFISRIGSWEALVSAQPVVNLTSANLEEIWRSNSNEGPRSVALLGINLVGAWLATHPSATLEQRTRGLAATGPGPWHDLAQCGVLAATEGDAAGGGSCPVAATRTRHQPAGAHGATLVNVYLTGALPAINSPARAAALIALTPTFPGTLRELLTTVSTLTP